MFTSFLWGLEGIHFHRSKQTDGEPLIIGGQIFCVLSKLTQWVLCWDTHLGYPLFSWGRVQDPIPLADRNYHLHMDSMSIFSWSFTIKANLKILPKVLWTPSASSLLFSSSLSIFWTSIATICPSTCKRRKTVNNQIMLTCSTYVLPSFMEHTLFTQIIHYAGLKWNWVNKTRLYEVPIKWPPPPFFALQLDKWRIFGFFLSFSCVWFDLTLLILILFSP